MSDDHTYLFDEQIAARLRGLAYYFRAAIDELLAQTRIEPLQDHEVGPSETAFWETAASLEERLRMGQDEGGSF